MEQKEKKYTKIDNGLRKALFWIERIIAVLTLLGLGGALIMECWHMVSGPGYYQDVTVLLHNLLAIVVGLEFVRMLIDTTPANVIEVLVLAITRHVVLTHEEPWGIFISILCIAMLFAVRRYLVRPGELQEEMKDE